MEATTAVPYLEAAEALREQSALVAYQLEMRACELAIKRLQEPSPPEGLRDAVARLLTALEEARDQCPTLADRPQVVTEMHACAIGLVEAACDVMSCPLSQREMLCRARRDAMWTELICESLAGLPREGCDSSAVCSAKDTLRCAREIQCSIEQRITAEENASALVVVERAQAWLDSEVGMSDEALLKELEALELSELGADQSHPH
jgi:hypothetical protein